MALEQDMVQSITGYIVDEIAPTRPAAPPTPETRIIETGLIDSLGLFKLIAFIEDHFDVRIEPDEILIENFATINAITGLIRAKRPG
jgi:acyl carrier protein